MTLGPRDPATPRFSPRNQAPEGTNPWTPWTTSIAEGSSSPAERIQREHELGRAYVAAKHLEELLELAGLDAAAARARGIRDDIAHTFGLIHLETDAQIVDQEARDDDEPDDVRHARGVEDDYAEAARQATYVADGR